MGDAGPAYPLDRREARQLQPQPISVECVLIHQHRPVGFGDAGGHEPVKLEVSMGASIAVPEETVVRADLDPDNSPVGDRMS